MELRRLEEEQIKAGQQDEKSLHKAKSIDVKKAAKSYAKKLTSQQQPIDFDLPSPQLTGSKDSGSP